MSLFGFKLRDLNANNPMKHICSFTEKWLVATCRIFMECPKGCDHGFHDRGHACESGGNILQRCCVVKMVGAAG